MKFLEVIHWIIAGACLKLLLVPSYSSTDFEVHRNWMAITSNLPLKYWYFDSTSQWTLDYPPYFAFFEWILSRIANLYPIHINVLSPEPLKDDHIIMFQRLSVIATEIFLILGVWAYSKAAHIRTVTARHMIIMATFNICLILVDHIHFQYNGMLMGILTWCFVFAERKQYIAMTICFSCLVLMKHLFVILSPIFGIFLIQVYCRSATTLIGAIRRFLALGVVAVAALMLAFLPFAMQENGVEQLTQIFTRLFPFGRGLVHAYWAPNVWALYCAADKVLTSLSPHVPWLQSLGAQAPAVNNLMSSTSGIVGDFALHWLPSVSATVALLSVLLAMSPAVYCMCSRPPTVQTLIRATVYCSLCSFMLGYHVHEKAILIPIICQSLLITDKGAVDALVQLTAAGAFGLFPLFTDRQETVTKGLLYVTYMIYLHQLSVQTSKKTNWLSTVFLCILGSLFVFVDWVHPIMFACNGACSAPDKTRLPFLPLMLTSCVCAVLLSVCWCTSLMQLLLPLPPHSPFVLRASEKEMRQRKRCACHGDVSLRSL